MDRLLAKLGMSPAGMCASVREFGDCTFIAGCLRFGFDSFAKYALPGQTEPLIGVRRCSPARRQHCRWFGVGASAAAAANDASGRSCSAATAAARTSDRSGAAHRRVRARATFIFECRTPVIPAGRVMLTLLHRVFILAWPPAVFVPSLHPVFPGAVSFCRPLSPPLTSPPRPRAPPRRR
jgi:hypothetical protein